MDASQTRTQPRPIVQTTAPPQSLTLDVRSPVGVNGSYDFDKIVKAGPLLKRTRKTKNWKPVYIVLRPNIISIYKHQDESKLRHQLNLCDVTAVARQRDPKRRDKHVFGLFSPSRNFHLEAASEEEAQAWVEAIRRESRMDMQEDEMFLASPGGANASYRGFERSIDANISPLADDRAAGYSSSDADAYSQSQSLPKRNHRASVAMANRQASHADYSGAEHGSYSDFSDSALGPTARMSALSLSHTDARPPTGGPAPPPASSVYGSAAGRPPAGTRNPSQLSGIALGLEDHKLGENRKSSRASDDERVMCHGWIHLLKSTSGVRQWKKVWMVLRPKGLVVYKTEEEYTAMIVLPFASIIDAVEIDAISKSKRSCMQVISEERNYRFCAFDEESLAKWLGAFKSLLSKRKTKPSVST
ncbi:related to PH domain protein [Ramularia collo-cygni]|uniref:Related to PH domain protein n=1 Tax=Ramularia collo-cygni TaxID=112498 RepID=A0A2D3UUB2_9PEZI|nr:related to PH domain protein [Ramularia collo-cygni]CZT18728.1 related to PH domain protein [Ramularia collo-cygni]